MMYNQHIVIYIRKGIKRMPFSIILGDITKMNTDAIVDATGDSQHAEKCSARIFCKTADLFYTKGYGLKPDYIIHACSPDYDEFDNKESENLLRNIYTNSLFLAKQLKINSIAFPLIVSGKHGYPKDKALKIAVQEITAFLKEEDMSIYLVLSDKKEYMIDPSRIKSIESFINRTFENNDMLTGYIASRRRYKPEVTDRPCIPRESKYSKKKVETCLNLDDYMNLLEETFSEMLLRLIKEKNRSHTEIYKKANIDRRLFSKIRNDKTYTPKKQTAIAFAIALELSIEETRDLLSKAGYALSMSSKFDVIIVYFLNKKFYDIFEINEILFAYDQPLLGV